MAENPTGGNADMTVTKVAPPPSPESGVSKIQSAVSKPDRFTILRRHARGGLGEVLLAQDQELRRQVAIKRIQTKFAESAEHRRRFLREAAITARLEHPGIVPVHTLAQSDDGQLCYVMRFIQGESLAQAMKKLHEATNRARRLLFRQLLQRLVTVCNTLAYAHSRGVVHRDVKPANIMLGHYGETLLVDWGLAKVWRRRSEAASSEDPTEASSLPPPAAPAPEQPSPSNGKRTREESSLPSVDESDSFETELLTRVGDALGTPAYMSPEQATGQWDQVGPASDIFSLGAILYEMLTGSKSVQGEDAIDALTRAQAGNIVPPRQLRNDVPLPLDAICLKAMARDPYDRYATAQALANDIEQWLADEPVAAWREPMGYRIGRWLRRHRTPVVAAAVAVLLAVAALMVGFHVWDSWEQRRRFEAQERKWELQGWADGQSENGLAELHADRFDSAARIFAKAAERLKPEPTLANDCGKLEARHDRARRLDEFYRLVQKGERYFVRDLEKETLAAHEQALNTLGAFRQPDWWKHLPVEDLTQAQKSRLESEVHLRLLYLGFLRARRGRMNASDPQVAQKGYRDALDATAAAQRFHPCQAGYTVELYCRAALHERDTLAAFVDPELLRVRNNLAAKQPDTLADYYLGGMLHYWVAIMPPHPENQKIRLLARIVPGFNFDQPMSTAEDRLRTAATLEPQHYATYYWLARLLLSDNNPKAAELSAAVCIGLRPDYADGYISRAAALLRQMKQADLAADRQQFFHRALTDLNTAVKKEPEDFYPFLHRAIAYREHGEFLKAVSDCDSAIHFGGEKNEPDFYHCYEARAAAYRGLGRFDDAIRDYTTAIERFPSFIQGGPQDVSVLYAARGRTYLDHGAWINAIKDLTEAIARRPEAATYRHRAKAYRAIGETEKAKEDEGRAWELEGKWVW